MDRTSELLDRAAPVLCGTVVVTALLVVASRDYPAVGADFAYYIARLLDTDLYLRINGLVIQWYTPSFGGGLPAFPNPQHLQYSLLQALLYVTGPWTAVLLATAIVCALGYTACYRFLSRTLGFARIPSALAGVFFIGNGFYIQHLVVGHVGFQLFPLSGVVLHVLANRTRTVLANACLTALCVAMIAYQAGFYLMFIVAGTLVVCAEVVYLLDRRRIDWTRAARAGAVAVPLSIAMAAPKILAMQALMGRFPREMADTYPVGVLHGLVGFAAQLAGGMTMIPAMIAVGLPAQKLDGALIKLTGSSFHLWELDTGLSPVLAAVLLIGLIRFAISARTRGLPPVPPGTAPMLIALGVTVWLVIEATLAKGFVYPVLRQLPVLRSMHVNSRFAAIFILPLTIVGAALLHRWYGKRPPATQVAAVLCVALASPFIYLALPHGTYLWYFDLTQSVRDHERIRHGERFPVTRIDDIYDFQTFSTQSSSLHPYEPMFGYFLETFAPSTRVGGIYQEQDGRLNMTNPASFVFPELNGLQPFDRIRAVDRPELERFAARHQQDWRIPPAFRWLNLVAIAALAACVGIPVAGAIRRSSRRRRP